MLATLSLLIAFPLAILVALGRQSRMAGIRTLCVLYVELVRGVPLISVLFMASFMLPLFMPQGSTIDVLLRVLIGMTLFTAAYLAEVVRGGLQALPKGQVEQHSHSVWAIGKPRLKWCCPRPCAWWCRPP